MGERDIGERDIGDTVAACRFAKQLLIQIHFRGISGCLSLSQKWPHQARFLWHHQPHFYQPTQGMSLRSSWSWARLWGLWPWGRRQRLWLSGMLAKLLVSPR